MTDASRPPPGRDHLLQDAVGCPFVPTEPVTAEAGPLPGWFSPPVARRRGPAATGVGARPGPPPRCRRAVRAAVPVLDARTARPRPRHGHPPHRPMADELASGAPGHRPRMARYGLRRPGTGPRPAGPGAPAGELVLRHPGHRPRAPPRRSRARRGRVGAHRGRGDTGGLRPPRRPAGDRRPRTVSRPRRAGPDHRAHGRRRHVPRPCRGAMPGVASRRLPAVPEAPRLPTVPKAPRPPAVPGVTGRHLPAAPEAPRLPAVPEAPRPPAVAGGAVPGIASRRLAVPETPRIPAVAGGAVPGVTSRHLPAVPEAPRLPAVAGTPCRASRGRDTPPARA